MDKKNLAECGASVLVHPQVASSGRDSVVGHIVNPEVLNVRATQPLSATPRPFLRWAGSKRYLLSHLVQHLPRSYGTYFEPFLGSGSLFFLLQPSSAVIGDKCSPLICTYEAVRDNVSAVLRCMAPLKPTKRVYYNVRSDVPRGRFKSAANFIYLNYSCWNGLYRVNASGKFNVPFGRPKTQNLADPINLKACAQQLEQPNIRLTVADFEEVVSPAKAGDLVYFDPPYVTKHNKNGFRDYNESLFRWADQERLAAVAAALVSRRVNVMVSNARHTDIERLYPGFSSVVIERKSTLASKARFRGRAEEVLLVSTSFTANGEPA